jgi:hypothetical protein
MDWFSKKTSIAGIQLPNWMVVLGAIIQIHATSPNPTLTRPCSKPNTVEIKTGH